jgi:SpoVK/Ycf46/Vps4 family AAA+-type ATPase
MNQSISQKQKHKLIEALDETTSKQPELELELELEQLATKEHIDEFIKTVDEKYLETNIHFTGWTGLEVLKSKHDELNDPNKYVDDDSLKPRSKLHIISPYKFKSITTDIIGYVDKIDKKYQQEIKKKVNIDVEINNVSDLLKLIEDNPLDPTIEYNINMKALHNIREPLTELNGMIGLADMKNNVVDQIIYFIQDLHKTDTGDFMHTVIYGPPGTGKTEVAKIMGNIFCNLGILKKGTFKKVTRSDLVAGYLGQTAIKTRDVINECLGGVLFIDEAYSLGNNEKRDSFSKECIDTLCEALSAHKDNLMVIIAGYELELKECFFSYNQGLDSRFTWRFKTDNYKGEELYKIFVKKVTDIGWSSETTKINGPWFEKKLVYFKFFGRDIETLLSKTKIAHSRRVFCKSPDDKTKITLVDLEKGFELYLKNEEVKSRKDGQNRENMMKSMYV